MRHIKYLIKNPKKKEEIFRLIIRPDFARAIKVIRKKWSIDTSKSLSNNDYISLMENQKIRFDLIELMKKFKLPERLIILLHRYIINGEFEPLEDFDPEELSLEIHSDKEADSIT